MDRTERNRIERRIAKAERRLARGIDWRVEKYGQVSEANILGSLQLLIDSK